MKTASVSELKAELSDMTAPELVNICLRLIKSKKENKELAHYLLFQSGDEQGYINLVKAEINKLFTEVNRANLYFAKKSIRKILRLTNKYIKHIASKPAEVELLLYFCNLMKNAGIKLSRYAALNNLYHGQLKKIEKAVSALHEDLQYEYRKELERLYE